MGLLRLPGWAQIDVTEKPTAYRITASPIHEPTHCECGSDSLYRHGKFTKGVRKRPVILDVPRYGWRQDLMGMVIAQPPSTADFGADISTLTAMFTKGDI